MTNKPSPIIAAAFLLLFTSLSSLYPEQTYPYAKGSYLYVLGKGKPNPGMENKTQRRSLAREASILDGKAQIAAYIHGLRRKSGETIGQSMEKERKIRTRVIEFIEGVGNGKSRFDEEDNCSTILKVNRKTIQRKLKAKEPK